MGQEKEGEIEYKNSWEERESQGEKKMRLAYQMTPKRNEKESTRIKV